MTFSIKPQHILHEKSYTHKVLSPHRTDPYCLKITLLQLWLTQNCIELVIMLFFSDGTSQYVRGDDDDYDSEVEIQVKGLPCVTVLIGAYHIDSGLPIMGVVYQPFHCKLKHQ